jgi:predicted transcriptional regulator
VARTPASASLSFRLPRELRDELRRVAEAEANSESAVVRRLIARGLAQERATLTQETRTPPEAA